MACNLYLVHGIRCRSTLACFAATKHGERLACIGVYGLLLMAGEMSLSSASTPAQQPHQATDLTI